MKTAKFNTVSGRSSQRGSMLAVVLISVAVVALVLGGLFKYALTEKRLNYDNYMWLQSRSAAEAVVDFGMGQLTERFNNTESFPTDSLRYNRNPLFFNDKFFAFFADRLEKGELTKIQLPESYSKNSPPGTYSTELFGGSIPAATSLYISTTDPANADDPLIGMTVLATAVTIYGKATVEDFKGKQKTAYAAADLLVRDAPLFSHAIFYNMDLEIAPSPDMNIIGKVHTNGDLWYMSAGGKLNFMNTVSASGQIRFGRMPQSDQSNNDTAPVSFMYGKDADGNALLKSYKLDGRPIDEVAMGDSWRQQIANNYNYWVQSGAHGMGTHKTIAMGDYVKDDPETAAAGDALNFAYHMVMPAADSTPADATQQEVEKQKYAYKAGLTIEVDPSSGSVQLFTYERSGKTVRVDGSGNLKKIPLTPPMVGGAPVIKLKTSTDGLFDHREGRQMNLVEIDMGKLKRAIEAADVVSNASVPDGAFKDEAKAVLQEWGVDPSSLSSAAALASDPKNPANWWNGVVYVETPLQPVTPHKDGVVPAVNNWAVKLTNGSQIPNPDFALKKEIFGTTIATNGPMYVHGNYNADGNFDTDNEYKVDGPRDDDYNPYRQAPGAPQGKYVEAAASLVADAITVLSNNWTDSNSTAALASRTASQTEMSAAFISGIVPSGKAGYDKTKFYSGGVENFPRFLEQWGSGRNFIYRGSMVALFESEVAKGRWGKDNVYGAPGRKWGFNTLFQEGKYPPGMPITRTYKRINFRWLTKAEFDAATASL